MSTMKITVKYNNNSNNTDLFNKARELYRKLQAGTIYYEEETDKYYAGIDEYSAYVYTKDEYVYGDTCRVDYDINKDSYKHFYIYK